MFGLRSVRGLELRGVELLFFPRRDARVDIFTGIGVGIVRLDRSLRPLRFLIPFGFGLQGELTPETPGFDQRLQL